MDTEIFKKISYERKIRLRALVYLERAKTANIPEQFLRINKEEFTKLLSPPYHKDVKEFASLLYDNPKNLLNIPFIIIDGGNEEARKKAGFAVLFRLITCNKTGIYEQCKGLVNKLQTTDFKMNMNRNDIVDELKLYDVLFISEFRYDLFRVQYDAGYLFDELIESRKDYLRPTIISFSEAISSKNKITERTCGQYLADLSIKENCDPNPSDGILRIRVKI